LQPAEIAKPGSVGFGFVRPVQPQLLDFPSEDSVLRLRLRFNSKERTAGFCRFFENFEIDEDVFLSINAKTSYTKNNFCVKNVP
jgi:hypothetical protein